MRRSCFGPTRVDRMAESGIQPAPRVLDIVPIAELGALDPYTGNRIGDEPRHPAAARSELAGRRLGRGCRDRGRHRIHAEADVMQPLTVRLEPERELTRALQGFHQLDVAVTGIEIGEAHARLRQLLAVYDVETEPVLELSNRPRGVAGRDRDVIEAADHPAHRRAAPRRSPDARRQAPMESSRCSRIASPAPSTSCAAILSRISSCAATPARIRPGNASVTRRISSRTSPIESSMTMNSSLCVARATAR